LKKKEISVKNIDKNMMERGPDNARVTAPVVI